MRNPSWESQRRDWSWSDVSTDVLGDSGPWVWSLPYAWQAFADPGTAWVPPRNPGVELGGDEHRLALQIAYWAPLLTLTWGALGWVQPALGVRRWLDQGRPVEEGQSALRVIDQWWGDDVARIDWPWSSDVNELVRVNAARPWQPNGPVGRGAQFGLASELHLNHVILHLCAEDARGRSCTMTSRTEDEQFSCSTAIPAGTDLWRWQVPRCRRGPTGVPGWSTSS